MLIQLMRMVNMEMNPDGCIKITKGHPKDKRWDLNRFALSMVVNQHGIPIFARAMTMATNQIRKFLCKQSFHCKSHSHLILM